MEGIRLQKKTFNISKEILNYLIEKNSLYNVEYLRLSKCKKCSFINTNNDICLNYCNKEEVVLKKIYVRGINDYKHKKINKDKSLTKKYKVKGSINYFKNELTIKKLRFSNLQIKQILLYYYLSNSKGIISSIEKKKIAKALNCTIKTVENNNKIFMKHNLIISKKESCGNIYVRIKDYDKQYDKKKDKTQTKDKDKKKKKDKESQGYMVFSSDILKMILEKDNMKINEIRLLLKTLVKFDFNFKKKHKTSFLLKELQNILPSNFNRIKNIKALINNLNELFDTYLNIVITSKNKIIIDIEKILHGDYVKKYNLSVFIKKINTLLEENNILIKSKEYLKNLNKNYKQTTLLISNNIAELCLEYGYDLVKEQILSLKEEEFNSIDNIGATLRSKINDFININRENLELI